MSNARRILAAALVGASTLSSGELAAKESEMSSPDTHAAHAWAGKDTTEYQAIPDIYEWSDVQRRRYTEAAQLRLDQTFARLKPAAVEICAEETGKHPTVCERILNRTTITVHPLSDQPIWPSNKDSMYMSYGEIGEPTKIGADARFVNEASTEALHAITSHEIGHVIQTIPGARGHEEYKKITRMEPDRRGHPENTDTHHMMEASADMLGGRIARASGVAGNGLKDAWKTVLAIQRQNTTSIVGGVFLPGARKAVVQSLVNEIMHGSEQSHHRICGRTDQLNMTSGAGRYPCTADRERLFAGEIPKGYESLAGPTRKQSLFSKLMKSLFRPATDAARAPRQDASARATPSPSTAPGIPGMSHSRPASAKQADTLAHRVPLPSQRVPSIRQRNRAVLDEHRER